MSDEDHKATHAGLGRLALELERLLKAGDPGRDPRWAAFERAVLEHLHEEELALLPAHAVHHRAEVEALLAEHHEIRAALVRGRSALGVNDTREALLAIASFRLHQIREESGVYRELTLHG